jgi:hypothetical protein
MEGAIARARWAAAMLLAALLSGCALVPQTVALRTAWPEGVPHRVVVNAVPFFPQDEFQCGPAALATVLRHAGVAVTPQDLVKDVWLPERRGSLQLEMLAAARRHQRVAYRIAPSYAELLREVAAGHPVIVLQDIGPLFTEWHYAVVHGFDYGSGTLYLRSGTTERLELPFTAFERTWMKGTYWAMVALPPDRIAAGATQERWIDALLALARVAKGDTMRHAYAAALERWPDNLPAAVGLANELHGTRDFAGATEVLRAALRRHPASAIVRNNLAQTLSDAGRHEEGLAVIEGLDESGFGAEIRATRKQILERIAARRMGATGASPPAK